MVHLLLYCPLANELWTMVFGWCLLGCAVESSRYASLLAGLV